MLQAQISGISGKTKKFADLKEMYLQTPNQKN